MQPYYTEPEPTPDSTPFNPYYTQNNGSTYTSPGYDPEPYQTIPIYQASTNCQPPTYLPPTYPPEPPMDTVYITNTNSNNLITQPEQDNELDENNQIDTSSEQSSGNIILPIKQFGCGLLIIISIILSVGAVYAIIYDMD